MFRKELQTKLEKIFDFKKSTFDEPSEMFEQDTLFIQVDSVRSRVTRGRAYARVEGSLVVYAQKGKLPFGFFSKRVDKASLDLVKDLFFFELDSDPVSSPARMQNISERRVRFVFLYSGQYDPDQGQLTSVDFGG